MHFAEFSYARDPEVLFLPDAFLMKKIFFLVILLLGYGSAVLAQRKDSSIRSDTPVVIVCRDPTIAQVLKEGQRFFNHPLSDTAFWRRATRNLPPETIQPFVIVDTLIHTDPTGIKN